MIPFTQIYNKLRIKEKNSILKSCLEGSSVNTEFSDLIWLYCVYVTVPQGSELGPSLTENSDMARHRHTSYRYSGYNSKSLLATGIEICNALGYTFVIPRKSAIVTDFSACVVGVDQLYFCKVTILWNATPKIRPSDALKEKYLNEISVY